MLTRRHMIAATALAVTTNPLRAQSRRTVYLPFAHSPFPYEGTVPDSGKPFLDVERDGKRGHTSPRGGVYFVEPTYSDRRSLLHVGAGFRGAGGTMVVFLHGNKATLQGEVAGRQRVASQFDASGFNGVLVAPQFAVNALDSSAGHFWESGFFARYLDEAAQRFGEISGSSAGLFQAMPVIIVAYSGGYNPAAYALERGGAGSRIRGVILLDALFGELGRLGAWAAANHAQAFFVSAYGPSSRNENLSLRRSLAGRGIAVQDGAPQQLAGGGIWFIDSHGAAHNDFVTRAWVVNPLKDILSRIR